MYDAHTIVLDEENYSLFYYPPIGPLTDEVPTYAQPPFAGRGGEVTNKLIRKCQETGRHVYVFNLKNAWWWMKSFYIDDFVEAIDTCQAYIRGKHNVSSLDVPACCQGGWVTAAHNANNPHLYRKHAMFATPIDTHTGRDNAIEKYCRTENLMDYQQMLFWLTGGLQMGSMQNLSFSMLAPQVTHFTRWHKLACAFWRGDTEEFSQRLSNIHWDERSKNLDKWFLEAMEHHFIGNKLFKGEWVICGKRVDLRNITCDMYVYSGFTDGVTHPEQARRILDVVSSNVKKYKCHKKAGHTKVFTGEEELEYFVNEFYDDSYENDYLTTGNSLGQMEEDYLSRITNSQAHT